MKKALSLTLALLMLVCVFCAAGCKKDRRDTGNIDVDYGENVEYLQYSDETPVTFMYQSFFTRSSDEEDPFVAKGPDDNSVLMYTEGELTEARSYEAIAAYSDDEAQKWMTEIQLGLVASQGVTSTEIREYLFIKTEDHLYLFLDADVTYSTGLVQRNTLADYVVPEGTIYTVQSFAPISAFNKYGALFKDLKFMGFGPEEALPADDEEGSYASFDNGTLSFLYRSAFNATEAQGMIFSMVPESYGMLAGAEAPLKEGETREQLASMPRGELLTYLASLSGVAAGEADYVEATEENGVLRLEAHYTNTEAFGEPLYCVVVRFVKQDGTGYTLFAYMNEEAPIKDVSYSA